MVKRIHCCYKCQERTPPDCHSTCQRYKDERKELDELNALKKKDREYQEYLSDKLR